LFRKLFALLLIFAFVVSAQAQRRYTLGTSINLTAGGTNSFNGSTVPGATQPLFLTYGGFPSVNLTTQGAHSTFDANYSYGYNRTGANNSTQSHAGSLSLGNALSTAWKVSLSDSFMSSNNATAFNALRNVIPDPTPIFVFSPVSSQIVSRSNSANVGASYQYTDHSSLSFSMTHNIVDYGSGDGSFGGALLNQQRIGGDISYNYKTGRQETWSLGYNTAYFNFSQSQNDYSQSGFLGYSNNIFRDFTLTITTGVSEIQTLGTTTARNTGLNSSVSLAKSIKSNSFRVHYTQASGESSGIGTLSDTRQAGLSLNHAGRHTTEFVDVAVFDTHGILGNTLTSRGASATTSLGLVLSKDWSLQVGGLYQAYDHTSTFGFTQKQVFVSLRYNNPNLWTGPR
jgi:hypothetical protein